MTKQNIGLLSLGCNGTAGHTSLLNSLTKNLNSKTHFNLFIYSENTPKLNKKNIFLRKLNKQDVNSTVAGCLNYTHGPELIKKIKKDKINILILSTFFDKEIMMELKKDEIKTILINYPLRDTHKQAFLLKKYSNCFTSIYTLKGLQKVNKTFPNESILSPIRPEIKIKKTKNKKFNVLVTCGGGGLSSSIKFFDLINYLIEKFLENDLFFTIIKGNSKFKFNKRKNVKIIKWSNNLSELFSQANLIISEAGYFTLLDIIQTDIPTIMIPGKRGIDNQELRAVNFELLGAGKMHFPFQNKENLKEIVQEIIKYPEESNKNIISRKKICKDIFEGKNVFDKIIEEINKNGIN